MKAAVLHEVGQPLVVEDVKLDGPQEGEVRIRVRASGLCHSDLHLAQGDNPVIVPAVLGHEAAGEVTAVGEGVAGIAVGDMVATSFSSFCGHCRECQTGHNHRCDSKPAGVTRPRVSWRGQPVYALAGIGGFAEEVVAHRNSVVKLPEGVPAECAALMGCAVLTGVGAALNGAKIRPGSSVAVIGCGGVGLNVVQGARIAGAAQIIAVDTVPAKLEAARQFGATDVIPAGPDAIGAVRDLTGGGVDYAMEVIGLPETLLQAYHMARKGGSVVLVGMPRNDAMMTLPIAKLMFNEISMTGSFMGSSPFQVFLPQLARLYRDGKLLLDELISDRIGLDGINEAYARLVAGETRRNVIVF